jgi:hypothetical protein
MLASIVNDGPAIAVVEKGLTEKYGENYPGSFAIFHYRQDCEKPETLDDHIGMIGRNLIEDKIFAPKDTWNAGIRYLEKMRGSNFVVELTVPLAKWVRKEWTDILAQQKTSLKDPELTIDPIKEALKEERNDQSFIAATLLAAMPAVDMELDEDYMGLVKSVARRI